ncbi:class I SAM-dependent methyltransferase [bacterium]|nr:class I SAM-dependent methyltransferase [bacterium]
MSNSDQKKYYEKVAKATNLWELDTRNNRYYMDVLRFDRLLELIPPKTRQILDLGCGDGYLSWLLAKAGHQVTALDISQNRLKKFNELAAEYNITQTIGDIRETGLAAASFDGAVCSEVIEHIPDYERVIAETFRVLRPGGLALFSVPNDETLITLTCPHCLKSFHQNGHLHSFNTQNLPLIFEKVGFQLIVVKRVRSKIMNQIQYHTHMKYGVMLKFFDGLLAKLFPNANFYLVIAARKPTK